MALEHLRRAEQTAPQSHERPLGELALTVLVGVTGVGKSTALHALAAQQPVLPDRRAVTDEVMILPLAGQSVSDRAERFRLTARYRAEHPGGMAQALGSLLADIRHWGQQPIFDGLRGLDEVQYAAEHFPSWRFIALSAPDLLRVQRLLGRGDAFDQVSAIQTVQTNLRADLAALPGSTAVFSAVELDQLAELVQQGHPPSDILAKVKIVLTERQNYDPAAAEAYLRTLPAQRALCLDTATNSPEQVAQAIRGWL